MSIKPSLLPRNAIHSAAYAVARCPSARLSVCLSHAGILTKRLNVSSNFSPSGSHTPHSFSTKRHGNILTGTSLTGASNPRQR